VIEISDGRSLEKEKSTKKQETPAPNTKQAKTFPSPRSSADRARAANVKRHMDSKNTYNTRIQAKEREQRNKTKRTSSCDEANNGGSVAQEHLPRLSS
jgi:hypothetical protein